MSLLISFEGIDGSGKSTLIEKLSKTLGNSVVTREPRGTALGYKIWEVLNNSISQKGLIQGEWTNLFLFLASHSEHLKSVVKPFLATGKTVIIDRYIDSMFVYHGLNKKLGVEKIRQLIEGTVNPPFPQVTFILDVDPVKAQERLNKRKVESGEFTNFDSMEIEFQQKIRGYFRQLGEIFPARVVVIDADCSPDEVFKKVVDILWKKQLIQDPQPLY